MRALCTRLQGAVGLTVGAFDPSHNATLRNPPGCSCTTSAVTPGSSPIDYSMQRGGCNFSAAFDVRPSAAGTAMWTCAAGSDLESFPLDLLQTPALYTDVLGITSSPASFTGFAVYPNITTWGDAALQAVDYMFLPGGAFVQLAPGLLTFNYADYFQACNPSTCEFTVISRGTFATVIAAALGVLSGVNTILMLVIDRAVDFVYRTKLRGALLRATRMEQAFAELEAGSNGTPADAPMKPLVAGPPGPPPPGVATAIALSPLPPSNGVVRNPLAVAAAPPPRVA